MLEVVSGQYLSCLIALELLFSPLFVIDFWVLLNRRCCVAPNNEGCDKRECETADYKRKFGKAERECGQSIF